MSAREELMATGRLGQAGAELLYATVRAVAIARRFPPPDGHLMWDDAGIQSTAHDFLQGNRGAKRRSNRAQSTDERSFGRLLERAVQNHLRDAARATDFGKLIIDERDAHRPWSSWQWSPGWRTLDAVGGKDTPSEVSFSDLATAISAVQVVNHVDQRDWDA